MPNTILKTYQEIKAELTAVESRLSNDRVGTLRLNAANIESLKMLAINGLLDRQINHPGDLLDVVSVSELNETHFDKYYEVTLKGSCINDDLFLGENWVEFLSHNKYLLNPPKDIYLNEIDLLVDSEHIDLKFEGFKSISCLANIINGIRDYSESTHWGIIYGVKIEIDKVFDLELLEKPIDLKLINSISLGDNHKEVKENLLKKTLVSFLSGCDKATRLNYLIQNFQKFVSDFLLNFETYISNYSFDKVRREHEEKRTEYIGKVNNVFQEISTKLIILPAPIWLAITQVHSTSDSKSILKGIAVIIITIFVTAFLTASIWGQLNFLESLKNEYEKLFTRLSNEYQSLIDCEQPPNELEDRRTIVWIQLWIGLVSTWVICGISIVIICVNW
ncbi:hypothetical protein LG201_04285 [Methylobacillus gramineus]|uniref:hypothetical protein n=1 Tax=Methylobacillus gramineus TaxID=755169 RepID=UPI001CFFE44B|nr:hypothetical protein [Methylobacillus gramineus]MCB5184418.1 hypothetical protein [Methylobacillus gramineus]